jgi:molybdopterin converting factor subunit 1
MNLRLLYFGIVRERLGRREESREIATGATVGDLLDELAASHGIFALGAGSIRIAVNREYVEKDHVLAEGDEVAVIPPVAGGAPTPAGGATIRAGGAPRRAARPRGAADAFGLRLSVSGTCWPFPAARRQGGTRCT